jgi:hypothetical protein
MHHSKPRTHAVMRDLIQQVRDTFPFNLSEEELCNSCSHGCPKKLLEYIDMECEDWQLRLDNGEVPDFGDIQRFGKTSIKIHKVLQKNGLLNVRNK